MTADWMAALRGPARRCAVLTLNLGLLAGLSACGSLRLPEVGRWLPADTASPAAQSTPPAPPIAGLQWGDRLEDAARVSRVAAEAAAIAAAASSPAPAPAPAPGTTAAAPLPAAAPVELPADYRIGPEDGLDISVWKDEALKATTVVRPDGGISFPLIGELQAAGLTPQQLRDEVVRRLQKYIPDPVVTVQVLRVASYRVYVLGRVARPGEYPVGRRIDVLQALSLAGGLTPFADEDEIRVIRKVDGKSVSLPFQYSRVRKEGDLSQNITLQSGDVLLVP